MKAFNATKCPQAYMLMFNVQKQKNFGNIVRSAAAFNVSEVFIIDPVSSGKKKMRTFGSQGTHNKTNFRYFDGLKDVR